MDRHQLDGRDAEAEEVVDGGRVGEAGVGAAELLRDVGVAHRHALHVGLVDDRVGPGDVRVAVVAPGKEGVDHDAARHVRRRVELAPLLLLRAEDVAEDLRSPLDRSLDRLGVGVEQQLGRVAAEAALGLVGAVDAEAVALAGPDAVDVAVPAEVGVLGELVGGGRAALEVEEHQLDPLGVLAEEREVGPLAVPGRAERRVPPGPGGPQASLHKRDISNDLKRTARFAFAAGELRTGGAT